MRNDTCKVHLELEESEGFDEFEKGGMKFFEMARLKQRGPN